MRCSLGQEVSYDFDPHSAEDQDQRGQNAHSAPNLEIDLGAQIEQWIASRSLDFLGPHLHLFVLNA